jgi:hypothetical protein
MDAVVSGQAGVAQLVFADGRLASVHSGEPDQIVSRVPGDYHWLFGDAVDLQFIEDIDQPTVVERLSIARDQADALHLTLILLDPDLSDAVRQAAAEDLEGLFESILVCEYVECVLFARPLPEEADLSRALELVRARPSPRIEEFLGRLDRLQPMIVAARQAWELIPDGLFSSDTEIRRAFESAAVREGLFRSLVLVGSRGRAELFAAYHNQTMKAFPSAGRVLDAWLSLFDTREYLESPEPRRKASPGKVPGSSDETCIDVSGASPTATIGSDVESVHIITTADPLVVSGEGLTVAAGSAVSDRPVMTDESPTFIGSFFWSGTLGAVAIGNGIAGIDLFPGTGPPADLILTAIPFNQACPSVVERNSFRFRVFIDQAILRKKRNEFRSTRCATQRLKVVTRADFNGIDLNRGQFEYPRNLVPRAADGCDPDKRSLSQSRQ